MIKIGLTMRNMVLWDYANSKDPDQSAKSQFLGPVVQSIVSLTSSVVVKKLSVLVSTISNSQVFLLKKCEYSHFLSKNISIYAIFNDQSFNDALTNNIISLEQLGPDKNLCYTLWYSTEPSDSVRG